MGSEMAITNMVNISLIISDIKVNKYTQEIIKEHLLVKIINEAIKLTPAPNETLEFSEQLNLNFIKQYKANFF